MWASFNYLELQMTLEQAQACSQPGKDAEEDVQWLITLPHIKRQRKKIDPDLIRKELSEYGAWDDEQLADDDANWMRLLWIAANDITEEQFMKRRGS
jgi:hypothetical protein